MTIRLFLSSQTPLRAPKYMPSHCYERYIQELKAIVANPMDVSLYAPHPLEPPKTCRYPDEDDPGNDLWPFEIITTPVLAPAWDPFVEWMRQRGFNVFITTTQWIYDHYPAMDEAQSIRLYLIDEYYSSPAWSTGFVLIGGCYDNVPARLATPRNNPENANYNDSIPTDWYYCELSSNWNRDGDDWWGEPEDTVDGWDEIYVGRVPVYTVVDLQNWIEKVIHYETLEFDPDNAPDNLANAMWVYYPDPDFPGLWDKDAPAEAIYDEWLTNQQYINSGADNIITELDNHRAWVNIYAKGDKCFFGSRPSVHNILVYSHYDAPPTHDRAGLNWLDNEEDNYVIYSTVPYNGAYDYYYQPEVVPIVSAFVNLYPGVGSVSFLGNTRNLNNLERDYMHPNFAHWIFADEYTPPNVTAPYELAVAENASKYHLWHDVGGEVMNTPIATVVYSHNYFGSPLTYPWIMQPHRMVVTHSPSQLVVGQPARLTVHLRDSEGNPIPEPFEVCLYKEGDIHMRRGGTADGETYFDVIPESPGEILITATKYIIDYPYSDYQYVPAQDRCPVVAGIASTGIEEPSRLSYPTKLSLTITPSNPVVSNLRVQYAVPTSGHLNLSLYNVLGKRVAVIKDGETKPGYYKANIDIAQKGLSNGVYWLILKQGNKRVTKKVVILKR